jgi:hypothetical protein
MAWPWIGSLPVPASRRRFDCGLFRSSGRPALASLSSLFSQLIDFTSYIDN